MASMGDAPDRADQTRIDSARLRSELMAPAGPYGVLDVVASTGSTNADLRDAALAGGEDRTVLIAEEQTAGVGRLDRSWVSPEGAGVYLSVLLRPPGVDRGAAGSLAMVAGLALLDTARELGVDAALKWPNDLLASTPEAKLAGILSELVVVPGTDELVVVLGIGLNVHPLGEVPPGPGGLPATSMEELGAREADRTEVAAVLLRALAEREGAWRAAGGDLAEAGLLADYREHCSTLGTRVRIVLPGDEELTGDAVDVDSEGQLIVRTEGGVAHPVLAGDVVHVRSEN